MVHEISLTKWSRARVWVCEGGIREFDATASVRGSTTAAKGAWLACGRVTVEALVPLGAVAMYGLLGVEFAERRDERFSWEIRCSGADGERWPESLAAKVDDVRLGFPMEYAQGVQQALVQCACGRFRPGEVRLVRGAHGAVGSSPHFFGRLAATVMEISGIAESSIPDELEGVLRRGLLGTTSL